MDPYSMDRIDSMQFWLIFTTAISWLFSLLLWYNNNQTENRLDGVNSRLKRLERKIDNPPKRSRPRIPKDQKRPRIPTDPGAITAR